MKGYLYTETCAYLATDMFDTMLYLKNKYGDVSFVSQIAEACASKKVVNELTRLPWDQFNSHVRHIALGKTTQIPIGLTNWKEYAQKMAENSPTAPPTWSLYTNNQEDGHWRQKHDPVIWFNESTNYFEVRLPVPQRVFNHNDDRGNVRDCYTLSQMKQGALRLRQNKKGAVTTILELHVPLHLNASFKDQKLKALNSAMIKARVLHAKALLWEAENLG